MPKAIYSVNTDQFYGKILVIKAYSYNFKVHNRVIYDRSETSMSEESYQETCLNNRKKMWRKVIRRLFIFSQLALALYYSNDSIQSWNASPIVTSGNQF